MLADNGGDQITTSAKPNPQPPISSLGPEHNISTLGGDGSQLEQ